MLASVSVCSRFEKETWNLSTLCQRAEKLTKTATNNPTTPAVPKLSAPVRTQPSPACGLSVGASCNPSIKPTGTPARWRAAPPNNVPYANDR